MSSTGHSSTLPQIAQGIAAATPIVLALAKVNPLIGGLASAVAGATGSWLAQDLEDGQIDFQKGDASIDVGPVLLNLFLGGVFSLVPIGGKTKGVALGIAAKTGFGGVLGALQELTQQSFEQKKDLNVSEMDLGAVALSAGSAAVTTALFGGLKAVA